MASGPSEKDSGPFEHVVQFYDDDDVICRAVSDFFLEGIDLGESLVLLATEARRQAVGRQLSEAGFDFESACGAGTATFADARELLDGILVDGRPDADRFASSMRRILDRSDGKGDGNGRKIRVFGELVDLVVRDGDEQSALVLEDLWNDLARTREFKLFCAYHRGNLFREVDGSAYREVRERHSRVIPAES